MEEGRFILSIDGVLHMISCEEYKHCNVLKDLFADTKNGTPSVPFDGEDVSDFVYVLRLTAENTLLYPPILDTWDEERRARVLTIANYVDCQHIISMCAWHDAKEFYEQDKRTCEEYKKRGLFSWIWKWM
jgi:hypothetical protein